MACDDLRIGGTLSASGITGGISINNVGIAVQDWSGIFGHVGYTSVASRVAGRPGVMLVGDALPKERYLTLNLAFTQKQRTGGATQVTPGGYLWSNTDLILGYLANPDGFYLEVDDPLTTRRFVQAYAPDPASIDYLRNERRATIPLLANAPFWKRGGTQNSNAASGAGVINNGGNATVYDALLTFSGAGTYTNTTAGWTLTVSAAAVVDLGNRTITVGGVNSDNLLTARTDQAFGWFLPGANAITRSVSVTTTWRDQYN